MKKATYYSIISSAVPLIYLFIIYKNDLLVIKILINLIILFSELWEFKNATFAVLFPSPSVLAVSSGTIDNFIQLYISIT